MGAACARAICDCLGAIVRAVTLCAGSIIRAVTSCCACTYNARASRVRVARDGPLTRPAPLPGVIDCLCCRTVAVETANVGVTVARGVESVGATAGSIAENAGRGVRP